MSKSAMRVVVLMVGWLAATAWAAPDAPSTQPASTPVDPMAFKPADRVTGLRRRISDQDYQHRSAAFDARIKAEAWARYAGAGERVAQVAPGGWAQANGWMPGDVVVAAIVADQPEPLPFTARLLDNPDLRPKLRQVKLWSVKKKTELTFDAPQGKFGVSTFPFIDPVSLYAAAADQRNPRWDRDAFVAAFAILTDAELAEAALARAQEAGLDGWMLPKLAMLVARKHGRDDLVVQWGELALRRMPPLLAEGTADMLIEAAFATYKLPLGMTLTAKYAPDRLPERQRFQKVIDAYARLKLPPRVPPAERPEIRQHKDLTRDIERVAFVDDKQADASVKQLKEHGGLDLNLARGERIALGLGPGRADLDVSMAVSVRSTAGRPAGPGQMGDMVMLGFADATAGLARSHVQVVLYTGGQMSLELFGLSMTGHAPSPAPWQNGQEVELRVIVHGPDCQVLVDDLTVFYGPVVDNPATRSFAPILVASGVTGQISNLRYFELPPMK